MSEEEKKQRKRDELQLFGLLTEDENLPYETADLMKEEGGHFVQILGDAWYVADPHNKARIVGAFPELFKEHENRVLARRKKEVDHEKKN